MDWKRYLTTRFWTRSPTASEPGLEQGPETEWVLAKPERPAEGPVCLSLWLEKISGEGEDAQPLMELSGEDRSGILLGVFDGLGGAGAMSVMLENGERRSHAYLASRLVRQACQDYFAARRAGGDAASLVSGLKLQLDVALQSGTERALQQASASRLRGTLVHQLPTTLALAYVRTNSAGTAETLVIWAGDSRIYRLNPGAGLVQLTVDDLQTLGDAFANLTNDSPMSNFVSASRTFILNYRASELAVPCVLLAATDGCFDYLPTPMHWEYLLLYTLVRANTPAEWARELEHRLAEVAGDDVSLALYSLGFESFGELKLALAGRFAAVKRDYVVPLRETMEEIADYHDEVQMPIQAMESARDLENLFEARRRQRAQARVLWMKYKVGYEWEGPPVEQEG